MDKVFKNINIEKRDRIINSALKEFSKNKFDKASTNNIVKNANISKGLLYHYFQSKKELFEYLEVFVVKTILKRIEEEVDWEETDIFKRIKQIIVIKFETTNQYPYIFDFAKALLENKTMEEIQKLSEELSPNLLFQVYNHNIDFTKFKDNIDVNKAITIIRWTFEKYGEELYRSIEKTKSTIDYIKIEKDINEYIKILKIAFYK